MVVCVFTPPAQAGGYWGLSFDVKFILCNPKYFQIAVGFNPRIKKRTAHRALAQTDFQLESKLKDGVLYNYLIF